MTESKKCKTGYYYCFTDKKCKKIPMGYHIGARGYLARDNDEDSEEERRMEMVRMALPTGMAALMAALMVETEESVKELSINGSKDPNQKDGKGGWVNVVTGGTCASDEPGEGTPKCVSSSNNEQV